MDITVMVRKFVHTTNSSKAPANHVLLLDNVVWCSLIWNVSKYPSHMGPSIVVSLEITSTRANLRDCINLIISIQISQNIADKCAYTCHCVYGYGNQDMLMYAKVCLSECMLLYNTFSSIPLFCCIESFEHSDDRCLCQLCISISF